jgi:hypothetical protein
MLIITFLFSAVFAARRGSTTPSPHARALLRLSVGARCLGVLTRAVSLSRSRLRLCDAPLGAHHVRESAVQEICR